MYWADLGPNKFFSGPDPAQKTGLGQDPPGPATKRAGELISPAPACRTLFVLHAEKEITKRQNRGGRRVTWRGGGGGAVVSGGALAEAGGGAWAHGRRLQVAAAVLCFFQCFPVTLPVWFSSGFQLFLPLPMFWSSFFSSLGFSLLSVLTLSLLCFFFFFFFCFLLLLRPLYSLPSFFFSVFPLPFSFHFSVLGLYL